MPLSDSLDSLEFSLIKSLQNLDGNFLDSFSEYVSDIPLMLATFGIIIAILIWKKNALWKPFLFAVIVSAITSYVINEGVFKMLLTTLLVMIVTYFEKRFLTFGIVIILLIGLSRVHNGMHYPSDVLIGTILGILYALVGLLLMKKLRLEKKHWWEKFIGLR